MIKKQFLKFLLLIILFFYLTKFLINFSKNKENYDTNKDAKILHNLDSNLLIYTAEEPLIPGNPDMEITGKYSTYGNRHIGRLYLQVEFTPISNSRSIKTNIYLNPTNENEFAPFKKNVNLNTNESYTVKVINKNTKNRTTNYGIKLKEFQVENPTYT